MSESGPVLELRGVCKVFGDFIALDEVDLTVGQGEVLGFLGPNGAGKTTTLRLVTGLLRANAGVIRVGGFDVARQANEAKRCLGYISDRPFLYEKLTGGEFLCFVGGLWGMGRRETASAAGRWLEHFDLTAWAGEPIEAYSHGMRQRLLLCAALLHQPALLIMDEPMVGLDPRGAAQLKQTVRQLAREQGLAVVLSTHTLDVVEQICDAVSIIDRGRIVAAGPLDDLRRDHGAEAGQLEELFLRLTDHSAATSAPPAADGATRPPTIPLPDEVELPAKRRHG